MTELMEAQRAEAMRRFAVLRPHLQEEVPLPRIAQDAGMALRTVQRWLSRYRTAGLCDLVRSPRADIGRRNSNTEIVAFIEGLFLRKPRPSVADHGYRPQVA